MGDLAANEDDPTRGPPDVGPARRSTGASTEPHGSPPPIAGGAARKADDRIGPDPGAGRWIGVGFDFGAAVVAFFFLGMWLDGTWGTSPWMRIAGAGLGVVLGTYLLIRQAVASESSDPRGERPPDRKATPDVPPGRTPPG